MHWNPQAADGNPARLGPDSANEGNVRPGALAVFGIAGEVLCEEPLFSSNADLGASDEESNSDDGHGPPRPGEAGREEHTQHRRVNRMTQPAISAGLDQFVILADGCLEAPLLAQAVRGCPDQH